MFLNLWQHIVRRHAGKRGPRPRFQRTKLGRRFRPCLEAIEDRLLLATFTVIDLGDRGAGSGFEGDLRYAINQANSNPDLSNRIVFQPGLAGTITLVEGKLVLSKSLEIAGPGVGVLTVSGNHQSGVMEITAGPDQTVILADLTIADGVGSGAWLGHVAGGGLFNGQARLTLNHMTIARNSVPPEGIGAGLVNAQGRVVLNATSVVDNHADEPDSSDGAIANFGTMTLNDSTVSRNTAFALGNSIENGGTMTLTRCLISDNVGGILNRDTAQLTDCTIANNRAVFGGGLEIRDGHTVVDGSLFANNSAQNAGGGIFIHGGQLTMHRDTLAGNTALWGGGVFTAEADFHFNRSTASGNTAVRRGGGIYFASGHMESTEDTITLNSTTSPAAEDGGGGLFTDSTIGLLDGVIVAGNHSASTGLDIQGTVISLGYNLIGQIDGSAGWRDSDLIGTSKQPLDPRLGPLADNGGETPTHALLTDSPAIGTGDPNRIGGNDQRRSIRRNPDIGAFETTPLVRFRVVAPPRVARGESFNLMVIALDQWNNQATTYSGAIHFSSTDFLAQLPDDSTFSPDEDLGVRRFSVTLRASGRQRIAVVDADNPFLRGEVTVEVAEGSAPSGAPASFWALLLWETDDSGWHLRRM